jgi:DNA polymerase V
MSSHKPSKIATVDDKFRVQRPAQTGFSSPATHYNEPRIDLNSTLVTNTNSTFFIRVIDDSFLEYGIEQDDVLIVDKSLIPIHNQLAMVSRDGSFEVFRINSKHPVELNVWGVITYIIKSVK